MNKPARIWVLTIFPEYFSPLFSYGVAASALRGERGSQFELNLINLKDYSFHKYRNVDDSSFGGGPGMVMRADILKNALENGVMKPGGYTDVKNELQIIYTSPRGKKWTNELARSYGQNFLVDKKKDLLFICGRYEGIDERFCEQYVDDEICIGDFVLTGGELAVMMMIDSALRFVPGTLGNSDSAERESFEDCLLDYPHYTKPLDFEGTVVPEVLMSGHHANIEKYRLSERVRMTQTHRPDLYEQFLKKQGKKK